MDAEDFKTLGECDFGTIWEVQSENKIVVNAYQAALYFSREDFLQFAHMVEQALHGLTGRGYQPSKSASPPPEQAPKKSNSKSSAEGARITDFRSFRKNRQSDDDNDDFTS